jgi:hypothetical protein
LDTAKAWVHEVGNHPAGNALVGQERVANLAFNTTATGKPMAGASPTTWPALLRVRRFFQYVPLAPPG